MTDISRAPSTRPEFVNPLDKIEQLLTCAICLDRYRNPKLLPCQHTFCMEPCLEGLVDLVRRSVKCPECRADHPLPYDGIKSFQTNYTLTGFLEIHLQGSSDNAEELEAYIKRYNMERCGMCNEKTEVEYCAHCEKKVCSECIGSHRDMLKRDLNRLVSQIKRLTNRVNDASASLSKGLDGLTSNVDTVRNEITDCIQRYIKDLQKRQEVLLTELDAFVSAEARTMKAHKEELELESSNIEEAVAKTEAFIRGELDIPDEQLMRLKAMFVDGLEQLRGFNLADCDQFTHKKIRFHSAEPATLATSITGLGELHIGTTHHLSGIKGGQLDPPLTPRFLNALQLESDSVKMPPSGRQSVDISSLDATSTWLQQLQQQRPTPAATETTGSRRTEGGHRRRQYGHRSSGANPVDANTNDVYSRHNRISTTTTERTTGRSSNFLEAPGAGLGSQARGGTGRRRNDSETNNDTTTEDPDAVLEQLRTSLSPMPGGSSQQRRRERELRSEQEDAELNDRISKIRRDYETRHIQATAVALASRSRSPDLQPASAQNPDDLESSPRESRSVGRALVSSPPAVVRHPSPPMSASTTSDVTTSSSSPAHSSEVASSDDEEGGSGGTRDTGGSRAPIRIYQKQEPPTRHSGRKGLSNVREADAGGDGGYGASSSSRPQATDDRSLSPVATQDWRKYLISPDEPLGAGSNHESRHDVSNTNETEDGYRPSSFRARYGLEDPPAAETGTDSNPASAGPIRRSDSYSLLLQDAAELLAITGASNRRGETGRTEARTGDSSDNHRSSRYRRKAERSHTTGVSSRAAAAATSEPPDDPSTSSATGAEFKVADGSGSKCFRVYSTPKVKYLDKRRSIVSFGAKGGKPGQFNWPRGIAASSWSNEIAVCDSSNHRVQIFDSRGQYLRSYGSYGTQQGEFDCLAGIATNKHRQFVITDRYNHRVQIFDANGVAIREFGTHGQTNGKFSSPWGVAVDSQGFIYVCDKDNHRVQIFQADGRYAGKFGSIGNREGQFQNPHFIAFSKVSGGQLFVTDSSNHRVQAFDTNGHFQFAFGSEGFHEGQFKYPRGIAVDEAGNIIVADSGNNRLQVFHPDGRFHSAFGSWGSGEGQLKQVEGLAILKDGRIVVTDRENHRVQIF